MKESEINTAIAEACGWQDIKRCTRRLKPDAQGVALMGIDPDGDHTGGATEYASVPSYTTDLNAMHEAEKVLTAIQKIERVRQLCHICDREYGSEIVPSDVLDPIEMTSMFLDCTARQRAEAFLRTLNKWKE